MLESQSSEKDRGSRLWLLKAMGLALGLAMVIVTLGVIVITALESPSSRSATAAPNSRNGQPANNGSAPLAATSTDAIAPADSVLPTETPQPPNTPAPTVTPAQAVTRAPMDAPLPTATSMPTATPSPTATQRATFRSTSSGQRKPIATTTLKAPAGPLGFYWYYGAYCHKFDDNIQVIDVMITGHGGQPPYDYYNDDMQFAKGVTGLARLTVKSPSGNPVPFKIMVVDSNGQRYVEDWFLKTRLHCKSGS